MTDPQRRHDELRAEVRSSQLAFLRTELEVAKSLLDLATSLEDAATQVRRRSLAEEACTEVARRLSENSRGITLCEDDREELSAELWRLHRRLHEHEQRS